MKIISKVIKFNDRKMVEIPAKYRKGFEIGEEVAIKKVRKT
jgi:hypothetical protein